MATVYFAAGDAGDYLVHVLLREDYDIIGFDVAMCGEVVQTGPGERVGVVRTDEGVDSSDICVECFGEIGKLRFNERGGIQRW